MKILQSTALALFLIIYSLSGVAQHDSWHWDAGVSYGMMNYQGDLSYKFKKIPESQPAFGFHWGILNGEGKSWRIMYNNGKIQGNDRVVDRFGAILDDNENLGRSLNFQTDIWDISLSRFWYGYNSKFLSQRQRILPYWGIGIGYTDFEVYGDLLYDDDRRYYYWTDGTIRDLSQSLDMTTAEIIEQDGEYETNLTKLKTESDELYTTGVIHIPLSLGFRFRVSDRLNLDLETNIKYAFTDHLDDVTDAAFRTDVENFDNTLQAFAINPADVTRETRGKDNGANDWYTYSNLTLTYNFGTRVNRPRRNTLPEPQVELPPPPRVERDVVVGESYTEKVSTVEELKLEIDQIKSQMAMNNNDVRVSVLEGEISKLKEKFRSLGGSNNTYSETRIDDLEARLNTVMNRLESLSEEIKTSSAPRVIYSEPAPVYTAPVYSPPAPVYVEPAPVYNSVPTYAPVTVYFNSGQTLTDEMIKTSLTSDVISLLNSYPSLRVHVKGYADKSGKNMTNLIISEKRANSVRDYLRSNGVDMSRIRTSHYGSNFEGVTSDISSRKVVIEFE